MLYPDMNLQKRTQQSTTRYRTALYLRLSREDGDKTESDSIANQRTLLEAYAADHPELCIVDEFVDDGYSGSNFERPAFQNLFRELEQGTINCVLVKDLSRFGRNYIEVGRYLERIFPVMRVRLIAVTDNYDSQSAWKTSDSIMVPMRNLLNDAYCRDISVKIKSQLAVKRKRGDFVGSFATYGYQKDPDNHTKLIVDELAAETVQNIFRWKINGVSNQGIADRLNAEKVPSPAARKLQSGAKLSLHFRKSDEPPWSAKAVDRILHNEVYTGKLVQGKTRRLDYRSKKKMNVPMRDWTIVDNARTGMEYVLVGDYYLPALKLPRTRPIGRWGMLHKAYLKLRKPAYYQSLLLSGKLDTILANVEEQAVERYEVLIEQLSQREGVSEKLKEENQMEWVRRMRNLENRAAEIVKAELIYTFERR